MGGSCVLACIDRQILIVREIGGRSLERGRLVSPPRYGFKSIFFETFLPPADIKFEVELIFGDIPEDSKCFFFIHTNSMRKLDTDGFLSEVLSRDNPLLILETSMTRNKTCANVHR